MGTGDELYTKLGLNPERVAGYVYSGLFTSVVAAFLAPDAVKGLVDSLGGVLSTLAALALGIAVYVLYRQLIGEYFLYPLHHLLHGFLDSAFRRSGERLTPVRLSWHTWGCPLAIAEMPTPLSERYIYRK